MRIEQWTPEKAKEELTKRLKAAKTARQPYEPRWQVNHRTIFNPMMGGGDVPTPSFDSAAQLLSQNIVMNLAHPCAVGKCL